MGQEGKIYVMTLQEANELIFTDPNNLSMTLVYLTDGYAGNGAGLYLKKAGEAYLLINNPSK